MKAYVLFLVGVLFIFYSCSTTSQTGSVVDQEPQEKSIRFELVEEWGKEPAALPLFQDKDADLFVHWVRQRVFNPELRVDPREMTDSRTTAVFSLDENGKVGNVLIVESIHPRVAERLLEVIQSSPDWVPAYDENDRPLAVRCTYT